MNLPTLLLQLYVYLASSCTPRDAFPTRNHGDRGLWGQGAGHASQMVCKHSGSTLDTSDSTHNAGEFSLIRTPEISVVIRSREEERHLKTLINQIRHQTIKNTEIILVVDYSDSQTLLNLRRLRADKVLSLSHNQFNHAYSTNLGVAASRG